MTEDRPDPLAPPDWYGKGAGQNELRHPEPISGTFVPLMEVTYGQVDTKCAAGRMNPDDEPVCKAEREYILTFGDVAEHICPLDLCAAHALEALQRLAMPGQKARCTRCGNFMRLEQITDTDGNEVKAGDIKAPVSSGIAAFIQEKLDLL